MNLPFLVQQSAANLCHNFASDNFDDRYRPSTLFTKSRSFEADLPSACYSYPSCLDLLYLAIDNENVSLFHSKLSEN